MAPIPTNPNPVYVLRSALEGRCRLCLVAFLAATVLVVPARAATLVEKGESRAIIVLPEKPSPGIEQAAGILRDHLRQMSGADLPIRREDQIAGAPSSMQAWILVGEGRLAAKFGLSTKGLGPGGIVVTAKGHVLGLIGV